MPVEKHALPQKFEHMSFTLPGSAISPSVLWAPASAVSRARRRPAVAAYSDAVFRFFTERHGAKETVSPIYVNHQTSLFKSKNRE